MTGISKAQMQDPDIQDAFKASLVSVLGDGVAPSDIEITEIIEVGNATQRMGRRLLAAKIMVRFKIKVKDASASSAVTQSLDPASSPNAMTQLTQAFTTDAAQKGKTIAVQMSMDVVRAAANATVPNSPSTATAPDARNAPNATNGGSTQPEAPSAIEQGTTAIANATAIAVTTTTSASCPENGTPCDPGCAPCPTCPTNEFPHLTCAPGIIPPL